MVLVEDATPSVPGIAALRTEPLHFCVHVLEALAQEVIVVDEDRGSHGRIIRQPCGMYKRIGGESALVAARILPALDERWGLPLSNTAYRDGTKCDSSIP